VFGFQYDLIRSHAADMEDWVKRHGVILTANFSFIAFIDERLVDTAQNIRHFKGRRDFEH
ncbi:MAG: hypothetical protein ACK2T5_07220, partial [Anaerolineales bacterium]